MCDLGQIVAFGDPHFDQIAFQRADAHTGLEHIAATKPEPLSRFPHAANDGFAGVMGVLDRPPRGVVLGVGQELAQPLAEFLEDLGDIAGGIRERALEPASADIERELVLFLLGRRAARGLDPAH